MHTTVAFGRKYSRIDLPRVVFHGYLLRTMSIRCYSIPVVVRWWLGAQRRR